MTKTDLNNSIPTSSFPQEIADYFLNFFIYSLIWKPEWQRRTVRGQEKAVLLPPSSHKNQVWARRKPGAKNSIKLSQLGDRNTHMWVTMQLTSSALVESWIKNSTARTWSGSPLWMQIAQAAAYPTAQHWPLVSVFTSLSSYNCPQTFEAESPKFKPHLCHQQGQYPYQ